MTEYTPGPERVKAVYATYTEAGGFDSHADAEAQFDRFLARVRRDAAREALDGLAATEHRIARLEAQSDIRGRAVVIYRDRARKAEAERDWNLRSSRLAKEERIQANARAESAEARIKAVQDLIDQADTAGDWAITCSRLQWAIDGTTPNPYRASETA